MNHDRWTLADLHTAEQALERHRSMIVNGERQRGLIRTEPGCEQACATCDFRCSLLVACLRTIRRDLIADAAKPEADCLLVHNGIAYSDMAGAA